MNHRRWILSALLGFALLAAILAAPPRPAAACSMVSSTFDHSVAEADIIALGTAVIADANRLELKVDEYWKGGAAAPTLIISNRGHRHAAVECFESAESGPVIAPGTRLVAFLKPATSGPADWKFISPNNGRGYILVDGRPGARPAEPSLWDYGYTTPAAAVRDDFIAYVTNLSKLNPIRSASLYPLLGLALLGALALLAALALGLHLRRRNATRAIRPDDKRLTLGSDE